MVGVSDVTVPACDGVAVETRLARREQACDTQALSRGEQPESSHSIARQADALPPPAAEHSNHTARMGDRGLLLPRSARPVHHDSTIRCTAAQPTAMKLGASDRTGVTNAATDHRAVCEACRMGPIQPCASCAVMARCDVFCCTFTSLGRTIVRTIRRIRCGLPGEMRGRGKRPMKCHCLVSTARE